MAWKSRKDRDLANSDVRMRASLLDDGDLHGSGNVSESLQLVFERGQRSAIASVSRRQISRLDNGKNRLQDKGRVFQNEFVLVEKLLAFQGSLGVIDLGLKYFFDSVTEKSGKEENASQNSSRNQTTLSSDRPSRLHLPDHRMERNGVEF